MNAHQVTTHRQNTHSSSGGSWSANSQNPTQPGVHPLVCLLVSALPVEGGGWWGNNPDVWFMLVRWKEVKDLDRGRGVACNVDVCEQGSGTYGCRVWWMQGTHCLPHSWATVPAEEGRGCTSRAAGPVAMDPIGHTPTHTQSFQLNELTMPHAWPNTIGSQWWDRTDIYLVTY